MAERCYDGTQRRTIELGRIQMEKLKAMWNDLMAKLRGGTKKQ
jgi:hypothetical protein